MKISGQPVIVLGMHRSGTSALARVLSELGVFFGRDEDLYSANESNEEGYFEHKRLIWLHRRFELSLNLAHLGVDPLPEQWAEFPCTFYLVERGRRILEKNLATRPIWGWKDPDNSWFVPFTEAVLAEAPVKPHFVLAVRNPVEVADSQWKRAQVPHSTTLGSWLRHTLTALRDTNGKSRSLVSYSDLLRSPQAIVAQLASEIPALQPSAEQIASAVATVRPDLRHHASETAGAHRLPDLVLRVFDLCGQAANASSDFQCGNFDSQITELAAEFEEWCSLLRDAPLPADRATLAWMKGGSRRKVEAALRPMPRWQTLSFEVDAPSSTKVQARLYGGPCNLWIKRAQWFAERSTSTANISPLSHATVADVYGTPALLLTPGGDQVQIETPLFDGPYRLELELFLASGRAIAMREFQRISVNEDSSGNAEK